MFDILDGFVDSAENTIQGAMVVVAIAFVAMTWMRTKSLMPTLGALLLGAVVLYGVNNFRELSERVEEDVEDRRIDADDD
jgi:hypothetical protein